MGFLDYIQKIARATDSNGNISPIKTLQDEDTRKEIEQRLALDLRNKINDGTIPRYFYKYRSLPHALEIIRTGKLKFSTIDEFKDPFDGMGDRTGNEKEDYNTLTATECCASRTTSTTYSCGDTTPTNTAAQYWCSTSPKTHDFSQPR